MQINPPRLVRGLRQLPLAYHFIDIATLVVVDGANDRHVGAHNFLAAFELIWDSEVLLHHFGPLFSISLDSAHIAVTLAKILRWRSDLALLHHLQITEVRTRAGIREDVLLRHDVVAKIPNLYLIAAIEV